MIPQFPGHGTIPFYDNILSVSAIVVMILVWDSVSKLYESLFEQDNNAFLDLKMVSFGYTNVWQ